MIMIMHGLLLSIDFINSDSKHHFFNLSIGSEFIYKETIKKTARSIQAEEKRIIKYFASSVSASLKLIKNDFGEVDNPHANKIIDYLKKKGITWEKENQFL